MQTFIHLGYRELAGIRDKIKLGEPGLLPAYRSLLEEADGYLGLKPGSVVDKGTVPPSGDKHDFYSIGKYAWPDPETPDGMPYIRIDGRINPEVTGERYDLKPYFDMRIRVNALALAYFHSGEKRYAIKASELLRVWFLNPETRMNPNFGFASALPGVYDGMPIGIIEGVQLIELLDSVNLLKLSDSWTPADNEGLQRWFSSYTDWLLESPAGKAEFAATDNHGSWYAAQIAAFSIYCGDLRRAKTMMERAKWQLGVHFSGWQFAPRAQAEPLASLFHLWFVRVCGLSSLWRGDRRRLVALSDRRRPRHGAGVRLFGSVFGR
ncbi:hypothetical protein D7M11_34895 [Paenibacillus ginsengarvi]|uniref:Alginate lyase domain-containing protein n=1 Tax=Paenibacillus ginsengarvi TaxID=400777 RepID=A0A3B0AU86_9BACL|nr:alginate lyase family protein [Paenibacillus ginsengarvi]RKN62796.1 hypothetical protein D7M11_34895 [Paenibacillus ginsengarvi]